VQLSPAHWVLFAYFWQPPPPLHLPLVPQVLAPWSWQTFRVSSAPAAKFVQRPFDEVRAQLRQLPWQAFSQQTPSTQKFDAHSVLAAQPWPNCLGPQLAWTQVWPATQSLSWVQVALHAPLMQR